MIFLKKLKDTCVSSTQAFEKCPSWCVLHAFVYFFRGAVLCFVHKMVKISSFNYF